MSTMANITFPPQIGNYLLGQPLGSGVSGACKTLFNAGNRKLTPLVSQELRSVLHTYIRGKSSRSKSSPSMFRIPQTCTSARSIHCCREASACLPCGHLDCGAAGTI